MPVADETYDKHHDDDYFEVPVVDQNLLNDIARLVENAELYQREEAKAREQIGKLEQAIQFAQETLNRAEEKKAILVERNRLLEGRLFEREKHIEASLSYWRDYGLDVKEIHRGDSYEEYEFTFNNSNTRARAENCAIRLRYHDKKLEIAEQKPEILSPDSLTTMNEKLTHNCVNHVNGHVNYKSAVVLIKKDLFKDPSPSAKTCSHQPTETNNHICTSSADPSSMS